MICSMVMVRRPGMMGQHCIKGSFIKERRMGKENFNGRMVLITKVILLMGSFQVLGFTTLQIYKRLIKVNLGHLIWKAGARKYGLMEGSTKATSKMGKRTEKVYSSGLMARDI